MPLKFDSFMGFRTPPWPDAQLFMHPSRVVELEASMPPKTFLYPESGSLFGDRLKFGVQVIFDPNAPLTTTVKVRRLRLPHFGVRKAKRPLIPPRKYRRKQVDVLAWWVSGPGWRDDVLGHPVLMGR